MNSDFCSQISILGHSHISHSCLPRLQILHSSSNGRLGPKGTGHLLPPLDLPDSQRVVRPPSVAVPPWALTSTQCWMFLYRALHLSLLISKLDCQHKPPMDLLITQSWDNFLIFLLISKPDSDLSLLKHKGFVQKEKYLQQQIQKDLG